MENEIQKRRGYTLIPQHVLLNMSEDEYKAIYSNFYPVHIEHDYCISDCVYLRIFGYSPLFRVVEDGERAPEYEFTFKITTVNEKEVSVVIEKVEEVKK